MRVMPPGTNSNNKEFEIFPRGFSEDLGRVASCPFSLLFNWRLKSGVGAIDNVSVFIFCPTLHFWQPLKRLETPDQIPLQGN